LQADIPASLPRPRSFARVVALLGLLALAGSSAYYMLAVDTQPVEVTVSSIALGWRNGQPLYHAMDAPERHSLLYGPILYAFIRACSSLFSDPLLAGKISAAAASALGLASIHRSALRRLEPRDALLVAGFAACFLLAFNLYPLGQRGDALLFALTGLSIAALPREDDGDARILARSLVIGALVGLAMGVKVHAFVYFLPTLARLVTLRRPFASLALAGCSALVLLGAPFVLFPRVSPGNYLEWLQQASGHPLLPSVGVHAVIWIGLLLLPLGATLAVDSNRSSWLRRERVVLVGFALASVATVVFSSKHGAGRHHIIPLIPSGAWLWASALGSPTRRLSLGAGRVYERLLVIGFSFFLIFGLAKMVDSLRRLEPSLARSARAELLQILDREAGQSVAMGYGQPPAPNYLRAYPVAAGHPYLIDQITLMDMSVTGLEVSDSTLGLIENCAIDVWIQPVGYPPFVRSNYYAPDENTFGERLPEVFRSSYELDYSTEHLAVWRCARHTLPRHSVPPDSVGAAD
jgi:hypothetical protein